MQPHRVQNIQAWSCQSRATSKCRIEKMQSEKCGQVQMAQPGCHRAPREHGLDAFDSRTLSGEREARHRYARRANFSVVAVKSTESVVEDVVWKANASMQRVSLTLPECCELIRDRWRNHSRWVAYPSEQLL